MPQWGINISVEKRFRSWLYRIRQVGRMSGGVVRNSSILDVVLDGLG